MIKRESTKYTVCPNGKIKTGYKGKSKAGKEIPKKADGFVLTNPETGEILFPELQHYYGDVPAKLFIAFPSSNYLDVYSDGYDHYGSNGVKKRQCDGEQCVHLADESFTLQGGKKIVYKNGTVTECTCKLDDLWNLKDADGKTKHHCKVSMYMKAWVLNPETARPIHPLPYLFESHSIHSANNIEGMLKLFKSLSPNGIPIPFSLQLKKIKQFDKSYTLWHIYPVISSQQLIAAADQAGAETNLLMLEQKVIEESKFIPPTTIEEVESNETDDDDFVDTGDTGLSPTEEMSINQFHAAFVTGAIEGEQVMIQITKILEGSPTLDDLYMRAEILLDIKELSSSTRDKIKATGKRIKNEKFKVQ